jgi:hypothetical protein
VDCHHIVVVTPDTDGLVALHRQAARPFLLPITLVCSHLHLLGTDLCKPKYSNVVDVKEVATKRLAVWVTNALTRLSTTSSLELWTMVVSTAVAMVAMPAAATPEHGRLRLLN